MMMMMMMAAPKKSMHPNIRLVCNSIVVVVIFVFFLILKPSSVHSKNHDRTPYYEVCAPFACGGINFTFPFSNRSIFGSHLLDCGLPGDFLVSCDRSLDQPLLELVPGRFYQVKELFPGSSDRVVTVVDIQLIKGLSLQSFSTSYNSCSVIKDYPDFSSGDAGNNSLYLSPGIVGLNFMICEPQVPLPNNILANSTCNDVNGSGYNRQLDVYAGLTKNTSSGLSSAGAGDPLPQGCSLVELHVSYQIILRIEWMLNSSAASDFKWEYLVDAMGKYGVPLVWSPIPKCDDCLAKNGRCVFQAGDNGDIVCFHKGPDPGNNKWKLIVGITTGCSSLIILASLTYNVIKRRKSSMDQNINQAKEERIKDAKQFIKSYQSTLLTSFSFKDIKNITNGFKEKVGEGGFGIVYKGKLSDGRVVAVKLLDKASSRRSDHDSQDFINEVQTIGTIRHINIIRLYGFCVDRAKQALVYEYMQNGSLGDVLRSGCHPALGTDTMINIAVGVAEGVNYLHRGCDSRILHLDIKPQNILLDEGYNPKVSDFGLAKMYSRSRSGITMSEAKGTIGFIAPEIIMRSLGNPSDRSDVYSFGMVLLEMIGLRKRINETNIGSSSSRERYFPDWIYEELNQYGCMEIATINREITDDGKEINTRRKMIMVGMWCIQINPRDRPSMAQVLEMLLGKSENIAMPPKPLFFASSKNLLPVDETEINTSEVEESGVVSSSHASQ